MAKSKDAAEQKAFAEVEKKKKGVVSDGNRQETDQATVQATDEPKETVKTAKAGKRSAKAIAEAQAKQAKAQRKSNNDQVERPKSQQRQPRSRLERRGKKFQAAASAIDKSKQYSLKEAMELVAKTNPTAFDATVELHVRLGVDPRQADQNIRGNVVLPGGTGKTARIAVLAEGSEATAAKKAGADIVGMDELLDQIEKVKLEFDLLITTPSVMPRLGKYARILGPKGLMPNPKSGTVTNDMVRAVEEAKAGRVEYRVDSNGIVHLGIGKVSFGASTLVDNAEAVLRSIKAARPASLKGTYVISVFATTSMGPSIRINSSEANL